MSGILSKRKNCVNFLCKETQKYQQITRGYVFLPALPVLTSCTVDIMTPVYVD